MKDIQDFIGHSSTEAERKAKYRAKLESGTMSQKCPGQFPPEIEIEIETEIETEIDVSDNERNIGIELLSYWNSKNIIVHKKEIFYHNVKKKHLDIVSLYGIDEIKKAIDNYAAVLQEDKYYWSHKWTLLEFLIRGIEKFINSAKPLENFLSNKQVAPKQQFEYQKNDDEHTRQMEEFIKQKNQEMLNNSKTIDQDNIPF